MKKFAFITLMSLLASGSFSQVKDYSGRLEPKRGAEVTRLAIEDFTAPAGIRLADADSVILVRMVEVIRADLDFSPFYEIVSIDSLFMRHMELTEMTLLGWSRMGAAYVVKGEAEFADSILTFKYRLYSTKSGLEFARGTVKSPLADHRQSAHRIASEIIYYLTGEPGMFDSRICFISSRSGNKELYVCDYDGANIRQITHNGSINLSPFFSPDGKVILFTSYLNGNPCLYQCEVADGKTSLLAAYPGINSAGEISPDGNSIVCALSRDGNSEIYLLDRTGRLDRRLTMTTSIESGPCWSPTGNEIAFTSDRSGTPQIYVMDRDGINVRRLSYIGNYNDSPDWSPRGDKIAFVSRVDGRFNICTVDVTGGNFRVLTELGNNENPRWSPDGNHIVFSSTRTGTKEIYIMDLFGSEERRLTAGGGNSNPAWSKVGR